MHVGVCGNCCVITGNRSLDTTLNECKSNNEHSQKAYFLLSVGGTVTMNPNWHGDVFRTGLLSNVTFGAHLSYNNFLFRGETGSWINNNCITIGPHTNRCSAPKATSTSILVSLSCVFVFKRCFKMKAISVLMTVLPPFQK